MCTLIYLENSLKCLNTNYGCINIHVFTMYNILQFCNLAANVFLIKSLPLPLRCRYYWSSPINLTEPLPFIVDPIEGDILSSSVSFLDSLHLKSVTWDRVRTATASDEDMHSLVGLGESGLPAFRRELPGPLRDYF